MSNINSKKIATIGRGGYGLTQALQQLGESQKQKAADYKRMHTPIVRTERKIGRNDPCPCRSGRKFKKCHGK